MGDRKRKKHRVYMNIAHEISTLSTCDRKHVGAVVVKDDRIVSMGYNGAPSGASHCDEKGHLMMEGHCKRTSHAESNAIVYADRWDLKGGLMYVTCKPCIDCFTMIANSGISKVVFEEDYEHELNDEVRKMADEVDLGIVQIDSLIGEDV